MRLQKGDYGTAHKVAENAVETARRFLDAGASLIHMVDLDAAKDGSHANYGVVEQVIRETGATVELGGGIRSMQDVETVLALGVSRVIIGSAAVRHPEFVAEAVKKYGDKIVVGIDAKSETVRTDGWLDDSGENYIAFAERMESYGVKNIIFTDIDKDGMLAGPNFDQLAALRASVSCEIIASGGVSTLEDIAALKKARHRRRDRRQGGLYRHARPCEGDQGGGVMLAKRIIPCLDVKDGRVVKGVNFVGLRDAGDPVELAKFYSQEGADEIVFLDITATSDNRDTIADVVRRTCREVFVPVTVGGGIRTVDDFREILRAGADKISINSSAVKTPIW